MRRFLVALVAVMAALLVAGSIWILPAADAGKWRWVYCTPKGFVAHHPTAPCLNPGMWQRYPKWIIG